MDSSRKTLFFHYSIHKRNFPPVFPLQSKICYNNGVGSKQAGMLFVKLGLFPACQFPILGVNFMGLGVCSDLPPVLQREGSGKLYVSACKEEG
jgi:hypothetical protein